MAEPGTQHPTEADVYDKLDATLDAAEARWEPEPGDKIMGRIDRLDVYASKDGPGAYTVLRVEARDGSGFVTFAASAARLKNELERQKAQPGDLLAVKYTGDEHNERTGTKYKGYRVAVHHVGPRDPALAFKASPEPPTAVAQLTAPPDDDGDGYASEPPF